MNTLMETIQPTVDRVRAELARQQSEEGLPAVTLTGNMLFVEEIDAVWFEVADERQTTYWVTADMEERADWGGFLVAAESREEALSYDESN